MDKTNIYLHLYDYTTGDSVNLYLGTIFGEPEDITCEGQFVLETICLDQNPTYDFIYLKWNTMVLSLKDLDLPMLNTLQVPSWKKTQVRKLFGSSNSYFRIVAHSPNTRKVRPLTDVCNLQDETILDLDDEQPTCVVQLLDAGKYLLLGNFPLPWNYFCSTIDEIPKPIHGSNYVILKKTDLCQCSLTAGSWYIEVNIAYCTEEPATKTEGITDLTLFTKKVDFDAEEPNLIVEEDSTVLQDTSPVVNYKEVMLDFETRRFLSKPDLAMSLSEASHWL